MENNFTKILLDQKFHFSCGPHVSCFNECCRDLNQLLTPYDVLRIKQNLQISSGEFLKRFTTQHSGPESGLPIVRLKERHDDNLKCPFVSEEGCLVYPDRPSSCRVYPIARAVSRNRQSGKLTEHFVLIKEAHCKGFQCEKSQSVREWIQNQGLEIYNEMNDLMMEIISMKNQLIPGPLDIKASHLFYMACYDLDTFREKIFTKGLLNPLEYDQELLSDAETEDSVLLKIGLRWLQKKIFDQHG